MPTWAYFGATVREGLVVADLPFSSVKFSEVLNGHGQLSGTVPIDGLPESRRAAIIDATEPGRRAVYVEVNGQMRWGGPIWTRTYTSDSGLQITAGEWGSYFQRVILRTDKTYVQQDQLSIARDLISSHQALTGGNVRLALGSETSGVLVDHEYFAGDLPVVGDLLSKLADVAGGFDFAWPVEADVSGRPCGRLLLGYPTLGSTSPAIVVDLPRSVTYNEDAATLAVVAWAAGSKESGGVLPVATATDPALIDAGYPLLDKLNTYQDEPDDDTLQRHATADQQAAGGVLTTINVTVSMTEVLATGVRRGDQALVRLTGARFPGLTSVVPAASTTVGASADAFTETFQDTFNQSTTTTVITEPTVTTTGGGFEATMRVSAIDYDPVAAVCDLTLVPRVTLGGRVPTTDDLAAVLKRLTRDVRLLSVT